MTDNQEPQGSKIASLVTKLLIGVIFAMIVGFVALYAFSEIARVNVTPQQKLVNRAAVEANQELFNCILTGPCANGNYEQAFVEVKKQYPSLSFKAEKKKDGAFNSYYVATATAKNGYYCTTHSNTDVACGN
jgi:hypothetical protein